MQRGACFSPRRSRPVFAWHRPNPFLPRKNKPGASERPQKDDVLVFSDGAHAGEVIKPDGSEIGRTAGPRLAKGRENRRDP